MILEVENLKIYGRKDNNTILQNISFSVKRGRTLAIIGESGSGKSMMTKAIMGMVSHKNFIIEGKVFYDGNNMLALSENKLREIRGKSIAMIMQNPMTAFAPMITLGKQMVDTVMAHEGITKKSAYDLLEKTMTAVNLTYTEKVFKSFPHELSGGMLQRVMIVLTLILNPKFLIADEATTAVDVISEGLILEEFRYIKSKGITLVIVTHDFGVVASLADDVIVMKDGIILEQGEIRQVLNNPQHSYTKSLIESSILTTEEIIC